MKLQKSQSSHITVLEHLVELRSRIIASVLVVLLASSVAHVFHEQIIDFILKPIGDQKLVFLSPLDPLFFILKIDFIVGIFFSLPILVWLLFTYIKPIVTRKISRLVYVMYVISNLLILLAITYTYFIIVPFILRFLESITLDGIESTIVAQNYLNFFITQALIITSVFQIPLFLIFGIYFGFLSAKSLSAKRGYIYVGTIIVLAILTPTPDVFSLGIILLPTLVIFEVSLVVGRVIELFRSRK